MGLAEPRKRIKISHDPNNLTWAQSAESYGQKLLSSQGWKPGQGLGARSVKHSNSPIPSIKLSYKDDTLGLGLSQKSSNPEQTRTGLDAFHGLLGRLNSKDEVEAKKLEQNSEDRKLARWAQGRWGGVIFVPGGLLVQGDKFRKAEDDMNLLGSGFEEQVEPSDLKTRKAAKALRKAERQKRKEAKGKREGKCSVSDSACKTKNDDLTDFTLENPKIKEQVDRSTNSTQEIVVADIGKSLGTDQMQAKRKCPKEKRKRQVDEADRVMKPCQEGEMIVETVQLPTPPSEAVETPISARAAPSSSRSGRHLLRGRNIQAKRMAFADTRLLDEV
ncbi:hypothetical protein EPUS_06899 [Endocarpon pusillum Z07020]|uniref:Protein PXR1 n=1 Tax=Endocarpon pusillum (strain Z07020 / HMAS-L-300199) TaxID=1263415 RepID=U1G7X4_ENDPU|nr:uncharacterized protein EPUS_06899 [Endocarpon pusillum Z07020]ERF68088.1 hypothetical protein EPUS_06899 [Endocarpon pusillum Z07020]